MAALEFVLSQARRHGSRLLPSRIILVNRFSSSLQPPFTRDSEFCRSPTLLHKPSIFYSSNSTSTSSFLGFQRFFCSTSSSSSPESQSEPRTDDSLERSTQSASIKAVSYPVKPKDPPSVEEELPKETQTPLPQRPRDNVRAVLQSAATDSEQEASVESRNWTREDIRYMKDVPAISPVSYPSRVASLPEDRASVNAQLEQEHKRIEVRSRIRSFGRVVEEEKVPFPTLIKG